MSDTPTRRVAEIYDEYASHKPRVDDIDRVDDIAHYIDKGIIESHYAEEAWLSAIERLNDRIDEGYDEREAIHTAALVHRDVWGDR